MAGIVVALRAHHHDALVLVHRLDHPLAFVDENRERLFDVDILAGGAGHDGEHGVPVIRAGYDDAIDVLVLIHLAKVAVTLGIGVLQVCQSFFKPRLVDIAERDAIDLREGFLEIRDVLFADESEADEADTDAIIGPEDPVVGSRGQGGHGAHKTTASRWRGVHLI